MKIQKLNIFFLLFLTYNSFIVFAQEKNYLEEALKYAGDNRIELEKVINHYKSNSLKKKAAAFLIENMPGHYSYEDTSYSNKYYNEIDRMADIYQNKSERIKDSLYRSVTNQYTKYPRVVEDIKCITSSFLIGNIDRSYTEFIDSYKALTGTVKLYAYFGYLKENRKLELLSFDTGITREGVMLPVFWSNHGSAAKVRYNSIDYNVVGAIVGRLEGSGGVGTDVVLKYVSKSGSINL